MNADDRTTASGLYPPPVSSNEAAPVTAETPRRSAFRPISGSAPTSTPPVGTPISGTPAAGTPTAPSKRASAAPFAWTGAPTEAPVVPTAPSPRVAAPPATAAPASFVPNPTPASGDSSGAFTVGVDKVKGFAVRAKNSLTEGDDLAASAKRGGPRKARVLVSRIDPWSVLKMGFLLSIAAGIMLVVATFVLWNALNSFGLFALVDEWVAKLFDGGQPIDITKIFELNKVMSASILISVMNVILLTALSTIAAFLYNTVSSVVGGVYVTLTDD